MGIVSLKYDYCFKNLMANEAVRRHFISDVLGIPLGEIKSVRLANTFLWRAYRWQKQGILDVLLILNGDRKVNIEIQTRAVKHWDRRSLFYLAKMFTEDLLVGEKYERLKMCVNISILDFNLDEGEEYHRVYRLRDGKGRQFSDLLEVHIIELRKKLDGGDRVDDWIRLFNAETEEDLDMIKTENAGILEAVREVKRMGLGRSLKALYDAHMKAVRDQNARDDYVRDEGIAIGEAKGIAIGEAKGIAIGEAKGIAIGEAKGIAIGEAIGENRKLISQVRKKAAKDISPEEIAAVLEEDSALVGRIYDFIRLHPDWDDERICREL